MSVTINEAIYCVENASIAFGYLWALVFVVPILPVRRVTEVFGRAFFFLCGMTHIEHVIHTIIGWAHPPELHDHLIHAPQALAIWCFVILFRQDITTLLDGYRKKGYHP